MCVIVTIIVSKCSSVQCRCHDLKGYFVTRGQQCYASGCG